MPHRPTAVVLAALAIGLGGGVLPVSNAHAVAQPPVPAPAWVTLTAGSHGPAVASAQRRLEALGYWIGSTNGVFGTQTRQAVLALQKVAGLPRTGSIDAATHRALDAGVRPTPRSRSGHVVEVDKAHQVLLVVDGGRTTRIYNVSTGGGYRYGNGAIAYTPTGHYHVYRSVASWERGPLGSMYRSQYIVRGIAVHGVGSPSGVGAYPASHGCIRTTTATQDELLRSGALHLGTSVWVY